MASVYSEVVLERSHENAEIPEQVADVQWNYVDSQAASYGNNSVNIVTPNYAEKPEFYDYSSSIFQIPFEIKASVNPTIGSGLFRVGLKPAGYLALIDRIQIRANNRTLSNQTPMLSVYRHLVHIFDWSKNYFDVWGPMLGMGNKLPDEEILNQRFYNETGVALTAFRCNDVGVNPCQILNTEAAPNTSLVLGGAGSSVLPKLILPTRAGTGSDPTNNSSTTQDFQSRYLANAPVPVNWALLSRMMDMIYPVASETTYATAMAQDYTTVSGTDYLIMTCTAWLPARFIHDYFRAIGVARNLSHDLVISFNQTAQASGTYNVVAANTGLTTLSSNSFNFCPFMVTQDVGVQASSTTLTCTNPSSVLLRIGRELSGSTSLCRWWLPQIVFKADQVEKLRSFNRVIRFRDFNTTTLNTVAVGATADFQVTSGSYNPKRLFILVFPASTILAAGWAAQASSYEPYYSTTGAMLSSIQVTVNGKSIYPQQFDQLGRLMFQNLAPNYELNASTQPCLASGLYGMRAMKRAPIFMFDLSKYTLGSAQSSVNLRCVNSSLWPADILAVLEGEQELGLAFTENSCAMSIVQTV